MLPNHKGVFMSWQMDADPPNRKRSELKPFEEHLNEAVRRFSEKYGFKANVCLVNPTTFYLQGEPVEKDPFLGDASAQETAGKPGIVLVLDGVRIKPEKFIRPNLLGLYYDPDESGDG